MLDRPDADLFSSAPFVSSVMQVDPAWIDYNGHLNMAYYNVLFDRAVDQLYEPLGIGLNYVKHEKRSFFTAEVHLRYLRELHAGDPVRVKVQILGCDDKRLHYFEQLLHAEEGWVSATSENMAVHVDMEAKKAVPVAAAVRQRMDRLCAAHGKLPTPDGAGRRIGMPARQAAALAQPMR